MTRRVNGVFKGGGAKGLVYPPALHELRARGVWFESVAGSSAGAITAALIAVGYGPLELIDAVPEALSTVTRNPIGWLGPSERGLYRSDRLKAWLEGRLRNRLQLDDGVEPCFRHLNPDAIELLVVAMNLATKQPIVFSPALTPDYPIAEAVIASAAIPVVFPTRRLIRVLEGSARVDRVVDGGTWANYPSFVYLDPAFRNYHGLAPTELMTIGFVIEPTSWDPGIDVRISNSVVLEESAAPWPPPPPASAPANIEHRATSPRHSRFDHGSARRMGPVGALLTWAGLRTVLGIVAPLAAIPLLVGWWGGIAENAQTNDSLGVLGTASLIAAFLAVCAGLVAALLIPVVTLLFAPEAVESGIPAVVAASSVGPGVPPWAGSDPTNPVVRLSAPLGITTANFRPPQLLQDLALLIAGEQAASQLSAFFPKAGRGAGVPSVRDLLASEDRFVVRLRRDEHVVAPSREWAYAVLAQAARERRSSTRPRGEVTFMALFWLVLPLSVLWLLGASPVAIVLGMAATLWLSSRLILGRMRNQSMFEEHPRIQRWVGRALAGVLLVGFAAYVWSESMQNSLINTLAAIALLAGTASLISVASRLIANRAARRYSEEVGAAPVRAQPSRAA